jgi:hypothetical protein
MNSVLHLVQLFNEKRLDELIAYIEEDDFPPDTYDFEEAHELRKARGAVLELLGHFRRVVEMMDPSCAQDEDLYSIKESIYEALAAYMDLEFVVFVRAFDLSERYADEMNTLDQIIKELKKKGRLYLRGKTIKEEHARRDEMIIKLARESGLPSMNKQADYIHENWDNTDLSEFKRLSSERIRKILASAAGHGRAKPEAGSPRKAPGS